MTPYLLIQTSQAPYSSSAAIDALEAAYAATNIGLNVKFMFVDDGVFQLLNHQNSDAIAHKSMAKKLAALPMFDIEDIYVCRASAEQRDINLEELALVEQLSVKSVAAETTQTLLLQASNVLVF